MYKQLPLIHQIEKDKNKIKRLKSQDPERNNSIVEELMQQKAQQEEAKEEEKRAAEQKA